MKHTTKIVKANIWNTNSVNTKFVRWKLMCFFSLCLSFYSCTDFVEVDPPKNNLSTNTVFDDAATVKSALANIYLKMRDESLVSGNNGLSTLMGIYTDELDYYLTDTDNNQLYLHNVLASNSTINSWWTNAYTILYAANDIITGVENSKLLSADEKAEFHGQALFVRAYMHSLLASLYGDVPYITTTNYLENNVVSRTSIDQIYEYIINDLKIAVNLLNNEDSTGEKVVPNKAVANALLSRMYLYTENWEMAERTASILINTFSLEKDVTKVFLKSSASTLWQFKPNGISILNTYEANQFVIRFIPGQAFALRQELLSTFEPGDLRRLNWVGNTTSADGLTTLYYANKYKSIFNATVSLEYSILFRLEEQYLIRAEAQAQLNNLLGSQTDLNMIRNRAGLNNTAAITKEELLGAIMQERFLEFFTEQGHRWFDLKRRGEAENRLSAIKTNWKNTDIVLPIPETEIAVNPNLKPQNAGY